MTFAEFLRTAPQLYFFIPAVILVGVFLISVFVRQGKAWAKIQAIDEFSLSWARFSSPSSLQFSRSNLGVKMKVLENGIAVNIFNMATAEPVVKILFSQITKVSQKNGIGLNSPEIDVYLSTTDFVLALSASNPDINKFMALVQSHSIPIS